MLSHAFLRHPVPSHFNYERKCIFYRSPADVRRKATTGHTIELAGVQTAPPPLHRHKDSLVHLSQCSLGVENTHPVLLGLSGGGAQDSTLATMQL